MAVARTYLPLTPAEVRHLAEHRHTPTGELVGVAVAPGADEDVEYAAWLAAVTLAESAVVDAPARRVVAAADLDLGVLSPAPGPEPTAVRVTGPIDLRRIVAFHVDEEIGGGAEDLLWYDVTELPAVAALL